MNDLSMLSVVKVLLKVYSLQWRHNERDDVSNHQRLHCLLNCRSKRRSKNTSKLRVTGLCAGNSPVAGEFLAQKASNVENVSIWWLHHEWRYPMKTICSVPIHHNHRPHPPCSLWSLSSIGFMRAYLTYQGRIIHVCVCNLDHQWSRL